MVVNKISEAQDEAGQYKVQPSGFIPNETGKTLQDFACGSGKI